MPDYFTLASVLLKLPQIALDYAEKLHDEHSKAFMDGLDAVDPTHLETIKENFCDHLPDDRIDVRNFGCQRQRISDTELHLFEDESVEPYQLALFIQTVLKKFDLPDKIGFHWSNWCSKPNTDAYGGGFYYVSKVNIRWWSSYDVQEQFEKEDAGGYSCRLILGSRCDGFNIETFDTKAELDAFVKGVETTQGYTESEIDFPEKDGNFAPLPEEYLEYLKSIGYFKTDLSK